MTLVFQAVTWEGRDEVVPRASSPGDEEDDFDSEEDDSPQRIVRIRRTGLPDYVACVFVARVFGRTQDGESVCVAVSNFRPYFYLRVPRGLSSEELRGARTWLSRLVRDDASADRQQVGLENAELRDVWGFQNGAASSFLKVTCYRHGAIRKIVRALLSEDVQYPGCLQGCVLYESNLEPILRLLHIRDLPAAGWIRVDDGDYVQDEDSGVYYACADDLKAVSYADSLRAPLSVAAFDIECYSKTGRFPLATCVDCLPIAREFAAAYEASIEQDAVGVSFVESFVSCLASKGFGNTGRRSSLVRHLVNYLSRILNQPVGSEKFLQDVERFLIQHADGNGDPVVQIGTTIHMYGEDPSRFAFKHIVTLGDSAGIDDRDITLVKVDSERDLYMAWARMIREQDPDMLTGYNIFGFDFPYMYKRMVRLGVADEVMSTISREGDVRMSVFVRKTLASSALGDNELQFFDIPGRTCFDLMKIVQRDFKLESYKLDAVAEHFTGERKHDVSPSEIFAAWANNDEHCLRERARVARYCVQDCALCNTLICKLNIVSNTAAMATVCSVPVKMIHLRGQGIKLQSLVLKQCHEEGACFPYLGSRPVEPGDIEGVGVDTVTYSDIATPALRAGNFIPRMPTKYEGATVLTPIPSVYTDPVCVNDFASLYPSSMISENISHDTLVMDEAYDNLPGVCYNDVSYMEGKTQVVCRFAESPEGILPRILKKLLNARKETRAKAKFVRVLDDNGDTVYIGPKNAAPAGSEVKDAYDDFQKKILDGFQLALKVCANSLYGQCGAATSPIYLKPLAACTTATGRNMLQKAKTFMEEECGGKVIYGDTDSVFTIFPCPSNEDPAASREIAISKATVASREFRKIIKAPHDLEYEKCFHPMVLISRKRYAAKMYESAGDPGKTCSMGIVLKRRDNAPIVKEIYGTALDIVLDTLNAKRAIQFVQDRIEDLINGNVDIQSLIVTKSLKKDYKNPDTVAHKVLADRVSAREPGNAFQCNDRVPYVHIVDKTARLVGDRIETPEFIAANPGRCKIDYAYYVTNQICKPVCQLMALVIEDIPGYRLSKGHFDRMVEERVQNRRKTMSANEWRSRESEVKETVIATVQEDKEKYARALIVDRLLLGRQQTTLHKYFTPV